MKKIIFSTIFLFTIAGVASAQTSGKKSKVTSYTSTTSYKAKKPGAQKTSVRVETTISSTSVIPDNRKEYMQNGQLATWTGHQAAPSNGDEYVAVKDSADKKRKRQ